MTHGEHLVGGSLTSNDGVSNSTALRVVIIDIRCPQRDDVAMSGLIANKQFRDIGGEALGAKASSSTVASEVHDANGNGSFLKQAFVSANKKRMCSTYTQKHTQ